MSYNRIFLLVLVVGLLAPRCKLEITDLKEAVVPKHCIDPPKWGNCKLALVRYYYDVQKKRCQQFFYKGCEESENNFANLRVCNHECAQEEPYQPGTLPKRCTFPGNKGLCRAAFQNYYYNTETKKCEESIYGGCGANPNNVETIKDCIQESPTLGGALVGQRTIYVFGK